MTDTATPPVADEDGELRADLAATVAKLKTIRQQARALSDEEKELLADVRAAGLDAGEYTHGGRKVLTVSWPQSFNAERAAATLPEAFLPAITRRVPDAALVDAALADGTLTVEQWEAITTARVDAALAKDHLPPALYRQCLTPAANPTVKPA